MLIYIDTHTHMHVTCRITLLIHKCHLLVSWSSFTQPALHYCEQLDYSTILQYFPALYLSDNDFQGIWSINIFGLFSVFMSLVTKMKLEAGPPL
jgi:hypothetical protein